MSEQSDTVMLLAILTILTLTKPNKRFRVLKIIFLRSFSQLIEAKKEWALMSSIPLGPDPSLFAGFLLKRALNRAWASGRKVGIPNLALMI